jgi:DNA mismatch repair ATPase MutS
MQTPTPAQKTYDKFREKLPADVILLLRVGDFYETLDDDAQKVGRLLRFTVTQRAGRNLAGIPYYMVQEQIKILLSHGCKVALCEQAESPATGKLTRHTLNKIHAPTAQDRALKELKECAAQHSFNPNYGTAQRLYNAAASVGGEYYEALKKDYEDPFLKSFCRYVRNDGKVAQ